jgi:flagellar protein FlgJ
VSAAPALGTNANASALARLNPVRSAPAQSLAAGGTGLNALRQAANSDPKAAIKEAAKQFEALFMQELMKSMRATTMKSDMLDNNATEMVGGMLDQQYAQQLTGMPGGLADAISRQLERQMGITPAAAAAVPGGAMPLHKAAAPLSMPRTSVPVARAAVAPAAAAGAAGVSAAAEVNPTQRAQDFLKTHRAAAEAAAQGSGIPSEFMLAQAAHETGWGRREIRNADGSSAHNLFGIKATGDWQGRVAVATTTEVIDGVAHKVQARFRAYDSPEASFKDYARLITTSPRYGDVVEAGGDARGFAQGLQRAGYATDPDYAGKLGRVINTTLRLQKLGT